MSDTQKIIRYILLIFFAILFFIGVALIAMTRAKTGGVAIQGDVIIWGPPFAGDFVFHGDTKELDEMLRHVKYVKKNPYTMHRDLLEAIATGNSPDLVLIDASMVLSLRELLQHVPYSEQNTVVQFKSTFLESGEIFLFPEGVYAYPVVVDPLVMYWNRDLFTNALLTKVPENWDALVALVPKLTKVTGGTTIEQSAISFGEYGNVTNAKEILSTLFMQTGTPIINSKDLTAAFDNAGVMSALRFYTDFSNPRKTVYSWNKTLKESRTEFAAYHLAMYPGFMSELDIIREINPNLNFDIATMPQSVTAKTKLTYGKVYGLAMLKAGNKSAAYTVMQELLRAYHASEWENFTHMIHAQRATLTSDPQDPFKDIFMVSAIIARDWLQPDTLAMNDIFERVIDGINYGEMSYETAASTLQEDTTTLLSKYRDERYTY